MIQLHNLPPVIQNEFRNDPFIFVSANGKEINIKNLSALVLKNDVMHVIDVLNRVEYNSGKHPFFLQHTDLFKQAQNLFSNLFGHFPDKLIYTYKTDYTTSIFLFTSSILIEKAFNNEDIEINIKETLIKEYFDEKEQKEKNLGIEIKNITCENKLVKARLPQGVFPVIGALNSIDSGWRTPNFNLIFGSQYNVTFDKTIKDHKIRTIEDSAMEDNKEKQWLSNIDDYIEKKFKNGISLYSIDKFDFKSDNKLCDYYDPFSMNDFYSNALTRAQEVFTKTIINFLLAINRGAYLPLTSEEFSAFMPHFYGYDRIVESVKEYEDREKRKLKNLYDISKDFANSHNPLTCKHFIDFFLRDSIINFDALRHDPAKEILKAFENQPQIPLIIGARKEILSRFIENGEPNDRYRQFISGDDGQVNALKKAYPHLKLDND